MYFQLKKKKDLVKIYLAEFIGTCFLLMIVVGSGIMGQNLTNNEAITLLGNTISTGAGLTVLIWMLGKISGAHFNPAVSLVFYLNKQINIKIFFGYTLCQIFGAVLGLYWQIIFLVLRFFSFRKIPEMVLIFSYRKLLLLLGLS